MAESIENHRELVLGDTNTGVRHAELQCDILVVQSEQPTAESNMALGRGPRGSELDGVPDEVGDNLAQAQRVSDELVRYLGVDIICEIKLVLGRPDD